MVRQADMEMTVLKEGDFIFTDTGGMPHGTTWETPEPARRRREQGRRGPEPLYGFCRKVQAKLGSLLRLV